MGGIELYKKLETANSVDERIEIINNYFKHIDISELLPERCSLSEDMTTPSIDGEISIPFVVGRRYSRDEPYECRKIGGWDHMYAYLLALTKAKDKTNLLVVEKDGRIKVLPKEWMISPNSYCFDFK